MGVPLGGKPLQDVSPGDHVCYIHSGEPEWISALVEYLRRGLELNQKVVYVGNDVDPSAPEKCAVWANLSSAGVDTGQYLKKGQLLGMNGSDLYCPAGVGFDPQKSLAFLAALSSRAVQAGFSALRLWVDMGWAKIGDVGLDEERLLQLERMGNQLVPGLPLVWCCCYLQSAFQPSSLERALESHPIVAHPRAGCSALANTQFIPLASLPEDSPYSELDQRLRVIEEQNQTINQLRRRAVELEASLEQANKARKAQAGFTATASHELRTPLSAIIGYTDLCLDPKERNFLEENLLQVKENAGRLLERINDVLDFSRLEAGQLRTVSTPFSLAGLLEKVHNSAAGLLAHKQSGSAIQLRRSLDPSLAERVCGDEARVLQIMLNLVSNAVKFTDQGELEYGARLLGPENGNRDSRLQLFVRDTGRGMTEEFSHRIFQPFSQQDTRQGGTGLGLCISHRLAAALGGELTFQTKLGQGSTFCHTLPYISVPDLVGVSCPTRIRRQISRPAFSSPPRVSHRCLATGVSPPPPSSSSSSSTTSTPSSRPASLPVSSSSSAALSSSLAPTRQETPHTTSTDSHSGGLLSTTLLLSSSPPTDPLSSADQPASRQPPCNSASPVKVLVVDDDAPSLKLMERILGRAGYAVETAADGAQAVEKVRANPDFSLVLMDMQMPVMNGAEATKAIKALVCERCGQRRGGGGVIDLQEREETEEEEEEERGKEEDQGQRERAEQEEEQKHTMGSLQIRHTPHTAPARRIEVRIEEPESGEGDVTSEAYVSTHTPPLPPSLAIRAPTLFHLPCICKQKQPAVVFLSAQAMPGEMERVGADGYLVKPIGRQQLLEAVQRFAPLGLQ